MVNVHQILKWIKDYRNLGNEQKGSLELLVKEYPWFGSLQLLLAKSYKNEDSKLFNGALKKAAVYVGNRSVLYDLMHNQLDEFRITNNELGITNNELPITEEELSDTEIELEIDEGSITPEELPIKEVDYETLRITNDGITNYELTKDELTDEESDKHVHPTTLNEQPTSNNEQPKTSNEQPTKKIEQRKSNDEQRAKSNDQRTSNNIEDDEDDFPSVDLNKSVYPRFKVLYDPMEALKPKDEEEASTEKADLSLIPPVFYDPEKELMAAAQKTENEPHDFSFWLDHFAEPIKPAVVPSSNNSTDAVDLLNKFLENRPSISRPKAEFFKPENMARKSEEFHLDVVTETLAQILIKQGHKQKAIEVYEKLMLQNPNNSAFFAAQIEQLRTE